VSDFEDASQSEQNVSVRWEANPYQAASIVNQMIASEGPGTQFGPDGIVYLTLGHVSPPIGPISVDAADNPYITVAPLGHFALTLERARELIQVLSSVTGQMEAQRSGGGATNNEF
jgi:hypothetical protein